jgi:hypothetical protein
MSSEIFHQGDTVILRQHITFVPDDKQPLRGEIQRVRIERKLNGKREAEVIWFEGMGSGWYRFDQLKLAEPFLCAKCETNRKPNNDYLCEKCRYGN